MVLRSMLRGIASKVKSQVMGAEDAVVGTGFSSKHDVAFARLDEEADSNFKLLGAAVVGTWEVNLADIGRALLQTHTRQQQAKLIERMSDGVVPIQTALQGVAGKYRQQIKDGMIHGLKTEQLSDVVDPLSQNIAWFGEGIEEGWSKTVDYLDPLYDMTSDPAAIKAEFHAAGPAMRVVFDKAAQDYDVAIQLLPQSTDLELSMISALEVWREAVVRGLEMSLYECRTAYIRALKA